MHRLKSILFFLTLSLLFSCSKTLKEKQLTTLDVFPKQQNTDSTFVFSLDTIGKFEQISKVFCDNYDNKKARYFIRTEKNDVNFHINSLILCNKAVCGIIKHRNILFIDSSSDTVFKHSTNDYKFNSKEFGRILKKQILNKGANPEFSDSPYHSVIFLNFTSDKKLKEFNIERKLDTISKSYFNFLKSFKKQNIDSLKRLYPLTIRLEEVFLFENYDTPPPVMDGFEEIVIKPEDNNEPEFIEIETNN